MALHGWVSVASQAALTNSLRPQYKPQIYSSRKILPNDINNLKFCFPAYRERRVYCPNLLKQPQHFFCLQTDYSLRTGNQMSLTWWQSDLCHWVSASGLGYWCPVRLDSFLSNLAPSERNNELSKHAHTVCADGSFSVRKSLWNHLYFFWVRYLHAIHINREEGQEVCDCGLSGAFSSEHMWKKLLWYERSLTNFRSGLCSRPHLSLKSKKKKKKKQVVILWLFLLHWLKRKISLQSQ